MKRITGKLQSRLDLLRRLASVSVGVAAIVLIIVGLNQGATSSDLIFAVLLSALNLLALAAKALQASSLTSKNPGLLLKRNIALIFRSQAIAFVSTGFAGLAARTSRYGRNVGLESSLAVVVLDKSGDLLIWGILGFVTSFSISLEDPLLSQYIFAIAVVAATILWIYPRLFVRSLMKLGDRIRQFRGVSNTNSAESLSLRPRLVASFTLVVLMGLGIASSSIFAIVIAQDFVSSLTIVIWARSLSIMATLIPLPLPIALLREGGFGGLLVLAGLQLPESLHLVAISLASQVTIVIIGAILELLSARRKGTM